MDKIQVEYVVSDKPDIVETGSYDYDSNGSDDIFIQNAIKKSIDKIKKGRKEFLSGWLTIFVNRVRTFEVIIIGDPKKIIKPKIYRL